MNRHRWATPIAGCLALVCSAAGCLSPGSHGGSGNGPDPGGNPGPQDVDAGVPISDCFGSLCRHACGEGTETTISGRVFDPAGKNPLYNVVVFVPGARPAALPTGASCDSCSSLYTGAPIAVALTDARGNFTLHNTPDGEAIPLVVQVGKWRMQYVLPQVQPCFDNLQADGSLRLPRNHAEGDLPSIAISTGGADSLECLLTRVGIDESEYVPGAGGSGRIHIFAGSGGGGGLFGSGVPDTVPPAPPSQAGLWNSQANLMRFDIVMLSCEGDETTGMNQAALHAFASAGGRVFASHFHYAWFSSGPYASENLARWTAGSSDLGNIQASIVTTFPKGKALYDWLSGVRALNANGELSVTEARHNADVSAANKASQAWILADARSRAPGATEYLSFNTPTDARANDAGVPSYCGRVVYSDLHVGAASGDYQGLGGLTMRTPRGCVANRPLSPQEKALEFMLFDLSSCVQPDDAPQTPPIM